MKTKISELKTFDIAEHLRDDADIAAYLNVVIEENDSNALAHALGVVARARGMSQLAKDAQLSRESLYKSLSGERVPSTDTLLRIVHALGFDVVIQPKINAILT